MSESQRERERKIDEYHAVILVAAILLTLGLVSLKSGYPLSKQLFADFSRIVLSGWGSMHVM